MKHAAQEYVPSMPLDQVKTHPRNPRQGDVGAIHESIRTNGWYGTILVQRSTGFIIAGNHRYLAARQAGADALPAIVVDVDDDRATRMLLVDNRTNDLAAYDDTELVNILRDLHDETGTLEGTGFSGDDLDDLIADLEAEPEPKPPASEATEYVDRSDKLAEKWGTARGQVWQIGPHRLACGDATDPAIVEKVVDGQPVDMVWTDPPYGVTYQSSGRDPERANLARQGRHKGRQHKVLENDSMTHDELKGLIGSAFKHAHAATKPGGAWYVACPPGHTFGVFADVLTDLEVWRHTIAWVKDHMVFGRSDYHYQHEVVTYGWKPGAAHFFTDDRTQTTVWEIDRPTRSEDHPTMKPIELVARAIRNSSKRGHRVLDVFAGSGTTLVAADQEHRVGLGVELDPGYAAVVLERLNDNGHEPERLA